MDVRQDTQLTWSFEEDKFPDPLMPPPVGFEPQTLNFNNRYSVLYSVVIRLIFTPQTNSNISILKRTNSKQFEQVDPSECLANSENTTRTQINLSIFAFFFRFWGSQTVRLLCYCTNNHLVSWCWRESWSKTNKAFSELVRLYSNWIVNLASSIWMFSMYFHNILKDFQAILLDFQFV